MILKPGIQLLGEFTILRTLGQGGMGCVYLLERQLPTGNFLYAAKVLKDDAIRSSQKRHAFLRELQTWISLPDHENITTCYFFRTIADQLFIFSEYVNCGTLTDWVRTQKIKTPIDAFKTIAQCAMGLHQAHQSGVIHQDVKPGNILMTVDGVPKLTDFGLARAVRNRMPDPNRMLLDELTVTVHGLTPAFCSPEQINGQKVGYGTDLWSLAVTLLYALTGKMSWRIGAFAGDSYEGLLYECLGDLGIVELCCSIFQRCFQQDPWDRYSDLKTFAYACSHVVQQISGSIWRIPEINQSRGPFLENIDLKNQHFDRLRELERHVLALIDKQTDGHINDRLELAKVLMLKAGIHFSLNDQSGTLQSCSDALSIYENVPLKHSANVVQDLLTTYLQLVSYQLIFRKISHAVITERRLNNCLNKLRTMSLEHLITAKHMARFYDQLARVMSDTDQRERAVDYYQCACRYMDEILQKQITTEVQLDYARNMANLLDLCRQLDQTDNLEYYFQKGIELLDSISAASEDLPLEYYNCKAGLLQNAALILNQKGCFSQAVEHYELAIEAIQQALSIQYSFQTQFFLIQLSMNKAMVQVSLNEISAAVVIYESAVQGCESLIFKHGHEEKLPLLGSIYLNMGIPYAVLEDFQSSWEYFNKAVKIFEHLVYQENLKSKTRQLEIAYLNLGEIDVRLDKPDRAIEHFSLALDLNSYEIQRGFPANYLPDRGNILVHLAEAYLETGEIQKAQQAFDEGVALLKTEVMNAGNSECQSQLDWAMTELKSRIRAG